jgi:hypothetical protein
MNLFAPKNWILLTVLAMTTLVGTAEPPKADRMTSKADELEVTALLTEVTRDYKDGVPWGGIDHYGEVKMVSAMWIQIGKKQVRAPMSCFADLGDPSSITARKTKTGYEIVIHGGDGSEGYRAALQIRKGDLVKRTVASTIFPKSWNESTTYTNEPPPESMP